MRLWHVLVMLWPAALPAVEWQGELEKLLAVKPHGEGNEAAQQAWQVIAQAPPADLPRLIGAVDAAHPLAENWIRAAVGAVVQRAGAQALPADALEMMARDRQRGGASRLLAWEVLREADPARADSLKMDFLEDPVPGMRRPAIDELLAGAAAAADGQRREQALELAERALRHAREEDQIRRAITQLRDLGATPDVPAVFGFVMNWKLMAPFPNAGRSGYEAAYPPENEVNWTATVSGADGKPLQWLDFTSKDDFGKIDFNKPFGMLKEVTGYAATEFHSPQERDAEIRLGCKNAWKVWLNGEFLFGRDEYHRGAKLDQYRLPCRLKAGRNVILVKCCQNEQTEEWTVQWEFQLRVCDPAGAPIASAQP